ncbi:MAG TPA: hypothetical protein VFN79_12295 [Steroidobacteraceae bacterium]|nr:hypothetical protein [Steroidobacteraceae bacterium]
MGLQDVAYEELVLARELQVHIHIAPGIHDDGVAWTALQQVGLLSQTWSFDALEKHA